MKIQQPIVRYMLAAAMAIAFIAASVLFFRWLYWDNSSEKAMTVFADSSLEPNLMLKYADNVYINIINSTIPAAQISYESKYKQKLPSLAASIFNSAFNGANLDITDPKTYFSFVFTAFSQYDPNSNIIAMNAIDNNVPTITSFDEAPAGEIYFNDELEEEQADEAAVEAPVGETEQSGETLIVPDPQRLEIEKKQPSVLILHTHSNETYMPFAANNFHSSNEKENIIRVGNIITDVLESKYQYNVVHDKTQHDKYSYADSYINANKTLKSQLEKNKSIKVIMDVHRDAIDLSRKTETEKRSFKNEYTALINGKSAAKISLVIGPNNQNFSELQKFAAYVKRKMDKLYPGLYFKTIVKPRGTYNQFHRDHSLLLEIGSTLNTEQEAEYSAELMGNVMGEVLKDLEQ